MITQRKVYDRWFVAGSPTPVRVQMFDYVAQFVNDEQADKYVAFVKDYRAKHGSDKKKGA